MSNEVVDAPLVYRCPLGIKGGAGIPEVCLDGTGSSVLGHDDPKCPCFFGGKDGGVFCSFNQFSAEGSPMYPGWSTSSADSSVNNSYKVNNGYYDDGNTDSKSYFGHGTISFAKLFEDLKRILKNKS